MVETCNSLNAYGPCALRLGVEARVTVFLPGGWLTMPHQHVALPRQVAAAVALGPGAGLQQDCALLSRILGCGKGEIEKVGDAATEHLTAVARATR